MKIKHKAPVKIETKFRVIWNTFGPALPKVKLPQPFPGKAKLRCSICDLVVPQYPPPAVYEGKLSSQALEKAKDIYSSVLAVFDRKHVVCVQYFRQGKYAEFVFNEALYNHYFKPAKGKVVLRHFEGLYKRPNAIRG